MAEKDEKLENKEEVNKTKTAEKKDQKVENKKVEKQENKPAKNEQEESKPVENKPEEKKPEETKKTDKKENKDEQKIEFEKSYFDGGLLQLIGWKLLGALVTLITFGICYPFALCFIYKWQMKHTVINGKRLYFDGKGYQLLGRWLLWLLLSIITLGIYTLWIPVQQNKWILKHTHYEGTTPSGEKDENNKSQFDGTTLQYIGWILLAVFISVFSVGILFPCALCLVYNWRISHTVIDGDRMEFDGKSLQLLGLWIKWVLLSIITIGIYSLWIPISLLKWETKHTNKKGPSARSIRLDLPKFTLIGATTKAGSLTTPLRDRFGIVHRLELYSVEDLTKIVKRSAGILDVKIEEEASIEIARRSRGTPRIANRLLKRVRDYAAVLGNGDITIKITKHALNKLEIDELGLDEIDRKILETMIVQYSGRPVGIEALSATVGEEVDTIEDVYEPYLIQIGFIARTLRGRMVLPPAYKHLGFEFSGE